jgi:hypothetical protein
MQDDETRPAAPQSDLDAGKALDGRSVNLGGTTLATGLLGLSLLGITNAEAMRIDEVPGADPVSIDPQSTGQDDSVLRSSKKTDRAIETFSLAGTTLGGGSSGLSNFRAPLVGNGHPSAATIYGGSSRPTKSGVTSGASSYGGSSGATVQAAPSGQKIPNIPGAKSGASSYGGSSGATVQAAPSGQKIPNIPGAKSGAVIYDGSSGATVFSGPSTGGATVQAAPSGLGRPNLSNHVK